jgi:site-specific recombinase XerD
MKNALQNVPGLEALLGKMRSRLSLANYASSTIENYLRVVQDLGFYYKKDPRELEAEEVYEYLVYLKDVKESKWKTIHQKAYGLRYLYRQVLDRPEMVEKIPYPRQEKRLPVVLSLAEVQAFFSVCINPKHRCIFGLLYGSGLRSRELCNLRLRDIDSDRMQIRIEQGKGNKDRYSVLPEVLLPRLRAYFKASQPKEYLFNGRKKGDPMHPHSLQDALKRLLKRSKITKLVNVHSFRHSFACHAIEAGMDLMTLQKLLGHAHMSTTILYLQVSNPPQGSLFSPLDKLFPLKEGK